MCDTLDGQHTWLAPVLPGLTNTVYVVFDEPQAISKVLLWNYGKTQSRGVKELAVSAGGQGAGAGYKRLSRAVSGWGQGGWL